MATLPAKYPLTINRGATFARVFRWSPDGTNPQDFTGWTANLYIAQPGLPRVTVSVLTIGAGITLNSAGQIFVAMTDAQTLALPTGVYVYNLDLTDPAGATTRFVHGRLDVDEDAGPA